MAAALRYEAEQETKQHERQENCDEYDGVVTGLDSHGIGLPPLPAKGRERKENVDARRFIGFSAQCVGIPCTACMEAASCASESPRPSCVPGRSARLNFGNSSVNNRPMDNREP